MTNCNYVAIDVAKVKNDVLIEFSNGKRRKFRVYNRMEDYQELHNLLEGQGAPCIIGVEPTSNYHRPISYFSKKKGYIRQRQP
jgi:transposase